MPADVPAPGEQGSSENPFVLPTEVISSAGAGAAAGTALFPGIGTIIGGALGGIGSIVSGLFGQSSAQRQMDFQERMSSTAHQREVADLRKAGLNPILSASKGGASSPGGASATMPNPGSEFGQSVAQSAKMLGLELPALESNIRTQQAQAESSYASAESSRANAVLSLTEANSKQHDNALKDATRDRILALTNPEVGETLAHKALMTEQTKVQQATAKQVQAETARARQETINAKARQGKYEFESSGLGLAIDSGAKVGNAVGNLAGGAVGKAIFSGPSSAKRVQEAVTPGRVDDMVNFHLGR